MPLRGTSRSLALRRGHEQLAADVELAEVCRQLDRRVEPAPLARQYGGTKGNDAKRLSELEG